MTNSELVEEILHNASLHGMLDQVRAFAKRLIDSGEYNEDTQSMAYEHAYRELVELPLITDIYDIYD